MENREEKWKIESSEVLFKNAWWDIRKELVRIPDGSTYDYYVNHSLGGVLVVPNSQDGKFMLQRMYKHGARESVVEFPMGRLEKGEQPHEAAARELREETGLGAVLEPLGKWWMFPSSSNAIMHIFLGKRARKIAEPENNPKEIADIFWVTPEELREMLRDGRLASAFQQGAGYAALDKLKLL